MENPYILDEIRQQGGPKYMVSVMIIDGQILEPFWFVDSEGVSFNQTGDVYRKMLEEHYVPILLSKFGRRGLRKYWFQQDGLNMKNGSIFLFSFWDDFPNGTIFCAPNVT